MGWWTCKLPAENQMQCQRFRRLKPKKFNVVPWVSLKHVANCNLENIKQTRPQTSISWPGSFQYTAAGFSSLMQSLSSPIDNAKAKIMFRSKPLIQFIKVSFWYRWEEQLSKSGFAQPKKSYNQQSTTNKS